MFIVKTLNKMIKDKKYYSYRLYSQYRHAGGKSKKELLLNLGNNYNIKECDWRLLCDKVEELTGQCSPLFELEVPLYIVK